MTYIEACQNGDWHLHLWPIDQAHEDAEQCQRVPFSCRSWRHDGDCRKWKGALDWWRVKEALKKRTDWVFVTLTFHQPDDSWGRWQTYFKAMPCWDTLRKRLVRYYGKIQYISTWERHQLGGCHGHFVIGNAELYHDYNFDPLNWTNLYLSVQAEEVGFGYQCHATTVYGPAGLAGYLTNLHTELIGAGTKKQVPVDAPRHFRRIRASRGLLPPPPEPELQGQLVKLPLPEYNSEQPEDMQPCGCVGKPAKKQERGTHETNKGVVASAC